MTKAEEPADGGEKEKEKEKQKEWKIKSLPGGWEADSIPWRTDPL